MRRARAAAVLLLTLRGTPFVYQGEELGLEDALIAPEQRVDPGGRDGSRAPLPWTPEPPHGWRGQRTWLPFPPDAARLCASAQWEDFGSILHLYRRLIEARKGSPALRLGGWRELESPPEVLAFERRHGDERRIVCINFAPRPLALRGADGWRIAIASDGAGEGGRFDGEIAPEQALLLEPGS